MILDVYTCMWNEASFIPFFLAHYGPVCRRIIALDDGSDDGTLEIMASYPNVEVRPMPEERHSWVMASTQWWNRAWQESRDADWVGIVAPDEIVGPDLRAALIRHKAAGVTVLKPRGFDMVSETADAASANRGVLNPEYSKPCLFRPDKITGLELAPGNHTAEFAGEVVLREPDDIVFRHYRYLGREQTWCRYQALDRKRRPGDRSRSWGAQYEMPRRKFDKLFDHLLKTAVPVFP